MPISMTAAQNDESGDQGLARTVDKQKLKNRFCAPIQHRILNGAWGTVGFIQLGRPRLGTDSRQKKEKKQFCIKLW